MAWSPPSFCGLAAPSAAARSGTLPVCARAPRRARARASASGRQAELREACSHARNRPARRRRRRLTRGNRAGVVARGRRGGRHRPAAAKRRAAGVAGRPARTRGLDVRRPRGGPSGGAGPRRHRRAASAARSGAKRRGASSRTTKADEPHERCGRFSRAERDRRRRSVRTSSCWR